jgi:endonuclease/exonuclease/phosphatase family metal-dependent hydrolase
MDLKEMRPHLVTGLVFLFGLQITRVFFPSVMMYLSQELGEIQLALFALITFGLIFLTPVVGHWLSQSAALSLVMGGILLVRFALQFNSNALIGLILSSIGLALFVIFLPLWLQSDRNLADPSSVPAAAVSFPLAFLIDTVSRTLLWSYDLVWRKSWWVYLIVVGVAAFTAWLLWREIRASRLTTRFHEPSFGQILPLVGFGAWLYVGYGIILNPQALIGLTGWEDRIAHLITAATTAVGAVLAVWAASWEGRPKPSWIIAPAAVAVVSGLMLSVRTVLSPVWFILLALSLWIGLGWIFRSVSISDRLNPGIWRTSLALFVSFVLMLVFIFLNEFNHYWITPVAIALFALLGSWAAATAKPVSPIQAPLRRQEINRWMGFAARAAVAAVVLWIVWNQPVTVSSTPWNGQTIRVMTYNIHQGLNADFYMDLEEIARVIEAQDADIIGLNEVNRGRANNGYSDTLALISRRLNMPYVYGANFRDGQYGNAILSRYPIQAWENVHYATNTTEVRGLLRVDVVLEAGKELRFYSTHLDHTRGPRNARGAQILEAVQIIPSEMAIFSGDLNAPPQADEMQPLYQTGMRDVLEVSGLADSFTFWSERRQRIDYIFVMPDIQVEGAAVIEERASDHLPVVSDIRLP